MKEFIVVSDHPYYPEVDKCDTLDKAQDVAANQLKHTRSDDGKHDAVIYVCEVVSKVVYKSDY